MAQQYQIHEYGAEGWEVAAATDEAVILLRPVVR
jgi:hypothetical protein